ncbi:MAG: LPS export ABC transporter periplasmic protein LptC [Armatimonadetes bacterium]|nr:LPS export ABC transporter periplasmic protein LptC [Armatimonadota bacterium]
MRTRAVVIALVGLVLCSGVPNAEDTPKTRSGASTESKTEEVRYEARFLRAVWGDENKVLLKGGVKFIHGDIVLTCDQVEYDRNANIAVCPSKVTIANPECDITGDKGTAYFKKRIGVIEGSVMMLVKPKPEESKGSSEEGSGESIRAKLSKPTTITCQKLEYNYRNKVASATGSVFLRQDKRSASADKLVYDEKNELITLLGNVKGVDEDGQTFSSPDKVVICVKKGAEWLEAYNGVGTFKVETEEESPD